MTTHGLKQAALTIAALFCITGLAGCDIEQTERPLKFSTHFWVGYEPFYVAEAMNFYEPGSVHLIETSVSTTLQQALKAGSLDAVAVSLTRAFHLVQQNYDVTIIAVVDWSNGADAILAHPSIKTVTDLRGKSVAAELETVNTYLIQRAMEINGLEPGSVTLVPAVNDHSPDLYASGRVQAVSGFGYAVENMVEQGARRIFDSSDIPGEIMDVLLVRQEYLNDHPLRVKQLTSGWLAAVDYMKNIEGRELPPPGLLKPEQFKKASVGVRFAGEEENKAFLENNAEKLREIMKKKQAFLKRETGMEMALPPIHEETFFTIVRGQN